jgi:hypothetical protein
VDHKPGHNSEHTRIEECGGAVIWAGTWRVSGVLAVSRAFGDRPLKKYVISLPDVRHLPIEAGEEFVVLASDGLWDVVSNKARPCILWPAMPAAHENLLMVPLLCPTQHPFYVVCGSLESSMEPSRWPTRCNSSTHQLRAAHPCHLRRLHESFGNVHHLRLSGSGDGLVCRTRQISFANTRTKSKWQPRPWQTRQYIVVAQITCRAL